MSTTERLIALIRERHEAGFSKYGTTLDRKDLTAEQWLQHAIEEMLDGAGYLMRLKEEMAKREQRIAALEAHIRRMEEAGNGLLNAMLTPEDSMSYTDWVCMTADSKNRWRKAKEDKP